MTSKQKDKDKQKIVETSMRELSNCEYNSTMEYLALTMHILCRPRSLETYTKYNISDKE
jgi:hypothetical protein